jgi:hypothetical protein
MVTGREEEKIAVQAPRFTVRLYICLCVCAEQFEFSLAPLLLPN